MTELKSARPNGRLAQLAVGASAKLNYLYAYRYPENVPFIMLTEFPRSGGNWVRDMLADIMQLPAPRFSRLPLTFNCIAHNHDHRLLKRGIYVLRDPRDVFLSHAAKTANTYWTGGKNLQRRILKLHPSFTKLAYGEIPSGRVLEEYFTEWAVRPLGSKVGWGEHVSKWLGANSPQVAMLRYEDMHSKPHETLAAAVTKLTGVSPTRDTLEFAVSRNSFKAQTGRSAGDTLDTATKRQGIAGAWRKSLPDMLIQRFKEEMGEEMKKAGYDAF
ncbi:hypothetical protein GLP59_18865 [Sulfitobacter sp. M220]|uniref:sulfotransferase domain-containing protein n=1 Tax=Sulfitobacter sp. M220 TaxID=2675333 RepID=UPI001F3937D8|nr:sulfotransferase domain-containing protein [Sulfitobacter sp. M220]MCF7779650.1 hypothetical protein [Sulfitobacter sp. M220]